MNNSAGIFEFITDDYVVAGAKQSLGLTDTSLHDLYLKDMVNLGLKELKNLGVQVPCISQMKIDNHRFKLPNGFIRFTKYNPIVFVDEQGHAINGVGATNIVVTAIDSAGSGQGSTVISLTSPVLRYSAPVFVNNAFFKESPYDPNITLCGTVNVVNGWVYFSTDVIAQYAKIAYIGAAVDDNGDLMIPSYCERALTAFACARFCRTNFQTHGAVLPSYESEWRRAKAGSKGYAALPSSLEYEAVNTMMKTLI